MKLLPITTSLFKNYFLKFSDIRYKSDDNLFYNSFEETHSYKLSKINVNVDLRGDNTLFKGTFNQINFIMADETRIITRIYEKISNSFAQIGGLTQALIILSKTILYFWSENNVLIYLISTILPNEEKIKFFKKSNNNINLYLNKDGNVNENKNNCSNENFIRIRNIQNDNNSLQPDNIIRENIIPNPNNLANNMKSKTLKEKKSTAKTERIS